jgi:hypothetical protein
MPVQKQTITEKRIIWDTHNTNGAIRQMIAIFRDGKLEELTASYNERAITIEWILSDPEGFMNFAKEVRDLLLVKEVKDRMTK